MTSAHAPRDCPAARLLEVRFDDIRLLVSRSPQTLETAQRIAAEHSAFSDQAHKGLRGVGEIARAIVTTRSGTSGGTNHTQRQQQTAATAPTAGDHYRPALAS